jgi:hypothetical protein
MRGIGTDMGYERLFDEGGDNGAFTDTLWEVRCEFKFG